MKGNISKRKCKICGSIDLVYYPYGNHKNRINFRKFKFQIAKLFPSIVCALKPKMDIDSKLLFSPLEKIVKCNSCGYAVHYKENITEELLEKYYQTTYWQETGRYKRESKKNYLDNNSLFLEDARANGQYLMVKDYLKRNTDINLLEIGAASALTSRLIRYHNPRTNIDVVEPGEKWEKYYQIFKIHKIAKFFPFSNKKRYDYIHTSHWLEHVILDIKNIVNAINRMLVSNGLLFVEVPNCTKDYWDLDVGDTPHIHFFTEQSLKKLFEDNGFKLLKVGCFGATNKEAYNFHPTRGNRKMNKELSEVIDKSVRYSIPREGGDSLRAIFQKIKNY